MQLIRPESVRTEPEGWDATNITHGVSVAGHATAHNEGTWTAITAATDHDADGLIVSVVQASALYRGLLDIGLHTSNQDEIISDILVDFNRLGAHTYCLFFPMRIPSGTAIQARLRASVTVVTCFVSVATVQAGDPTEEYLATIETIGVDTTAGVGASAGRNDSGGSTVDSGGTANQWGAWKELTASTTFACHQAMLIVGYLGNNAMGATSNWRVQVGVGSVGTEDIVIDGLVFGGNGSSDWAYPTNWTFPFTAPAGSRVVVRASSSSIDATDRLFQAAMYLFS